MESINIVFYIHAKALNLFLKYTLSAPVGPIGNSRTMMYFPMNAIR